MIYDQLMAIHGRGGDSICLGQKGFTCLSGLSALGSREANHCAWVSSRSRRCSSVSVGSRFLTQLGAKIHQWNGVLMSTGNVSKSISSWDRYGMVCLSWAVPCDQVPDALFFLGVLFAVGGLERVGLLKEFAVQLSALVPRHVLRTAVAEGHMQRHRWREQQTARDKIAF